MEESKADPVLKDPRDDPNWLVDADEDRWEWRRRIRSDPRKHRIYRGVVAVVGTLLILLGAATGWLPGPGGIPLTLLGLAVLASEFEWAQRLLGWARQHLRSGREWLAGKPAWVSWLGGAATLVGIAVAAWLSLAVFGVPRWAPDAAASWLDVLPGVHPAG